MRANSPLFNLALGLLLLAVVVLLFFIGEPEGVDTTQLSGEVMTPSNPGSRRLMITCRGEGESWPPSELSIRVYSVSESGRKEIGASSTATLALEIEPGTYQVEADAGKKWSRESIVVSVSATDYEVDRTILMQSTFLLRCIIVDPSGKAVRDCEHSLQAETTGTSFESVTCAGGRAGLVCYRIPFVESYLFTVTHEARGLRKVVVLRNRERLPIREEVIVLEPNQEVVLGHIHWCPDEQSIDLVEETTIRLIESNRGRRMLPVGDLREDGQFVITEVLDVPFRVEVDTRGYQPRTVTVERLAETVDVWLECDHKFFFRVEPERDDAGGYFTAILKPAHGVWRQLLAEECLFVVRVNDSEGAVVDITGAGYKPTQLQLVDGTSRANPKVVRPEKLSLARLVVEVAGAVDSVVGGRVKLLSALKRHFPGQHAVEKSLVGRQVTFTGVVSGEYDVFLVDQNETEIARRNGLSVVGPETSTRLVAQRSGVTIDFRNTNHLASSVVDLIFSRRGDDVISRTVAVVEGPVYFEELVPGRYDLKLLSESDDVIYAGPFVLKSENLFDFSRLVTIGLANGARPREVSVRISRSGTRSGVGSHSYSLEPNERREVELWCPENSRISIRDEQGFYFFDQKLVRDGQAQIDLSLARSRSIKCPAIEKCVAAFFVAFHESDEFAYGEYWDAPKTELRIGAGFRSWGVLILNEARETLAVHRSDEGGARRAVTIAVRGAEEEPVVEADVRAWGTELFGRRLDDYFFGFEAMSRLPPARTDADGRAVLELPRFERFSVQVKASGKTVSVESPLTQSEPLTVHIE